MKNTGIAEIPLNKGRAVYTNCLKVGVDGILSKIYEVTLV